MSFAMIDALTSAPDLLSGLLMGFGETGVPLVSVDGGPPASARSIVTLSEEHVGSELVLWKCDGNLVILGRVLGDTEVKIPAADARKLSVETDGNNVAIEAGREIVLRAGNSSITLTAAGKVIIRGDYVLTRSTGVNQIKGASVQIN